MQEAQAIIERIRRVSPTIQRLDVAVNKAHREVAAGQLFLARTTDTYDPYLREPWIPVDRDGSAIVIERPARLVYTPGQIVNLIGPVGKPILERNAARLLLIANEASPAALLMYARSALERKGAVTLALIGRAIHYPVDALPEEIEVIRSADYDQWPNRADAFTWADQVVAVAPPPYDVPIYGKLLAGLRDARISVAEGFAYGLFHAAMPCGVGACQACLVRVTDGEALASCVEGPAFDLLDVNLSVGTNQGEKNA